MRLIAGDTLRFLYIFRFHGAERLAVGLQIDGFLGIRGHEQYVGGLYPLSVEKGVELDFVCSKASYIAVEKTPLGDEGDGQRRRGSLNIHILRRERARKGLGQDVHRAARLDYGKLDLKRRKIALCAQALDDIVGVHTQLFDIVKAQAALVYDDLRRTVDDFAELYAFCRQHGYDYMQNEYAKNRNKPVCDRNGYFGHGNASQISQNQSYDKFKGLQLRQLPLAHKPHEHKKTDINNGGAKEYNQHKKILIL
jgi:hypothetical protein